MQKRPGVWFVLLVCLALAFRIAFFIYFLLIEGEVHSPDSHLYLQLANNLAEFFEFSRDAQTPFAPEVFRTPGYPAFLAVLRILGMHSAYWAVFWQEIIYLACVLIFFWYGRALFYQNIIRISVLFMLVEPGGLAYPKEIFTEVLFLPWITSGLLAIGYYLRFFKIRYLIFAGLLFGAGAMVRPGVIYLPVVIATVLLVSELKSRKSWWRAGVFLLTFALSLSPWLIRNYYHFGKVFMSGQQSNMLVNFHAPIVLRAAKGWSFEIGYEYMREQVALAEQKKQMQLNRPLSTVEKFELEQRTAFQELAKYPKEYFIQWIYGIVKTMGSAHLLEVYHELRIPVDDLSFQAGAAEGVRGKLFRFLIETDHFYISEVLIRVR